MHLKLTDLQADAFLTMKTRQRAAVIDDAFDEFKRVFKEEGVIGEVVEMLKKMVGETIRRENERKRQVKIE